VTDRALRILVVSNIYPPVVRGGYEVECRSAVEVLREEHEVVVLTSDLESEGIAPMVGVRRELPWVGPRKRDSLRAPGLAVRGARVIERVLDEVRPDLVYVWNGARIPQAVLRILDRHDVPRAYRVCEHWFGELYRSDQFMRHLYPGDRGVRALWARWARLVNRRAGLRLKFTPPAPVAISWNSEFMRSRTTVPPTFTPVLEEMSYPVTPQVGRFAALERRPLPDPTIAFVGRLTWEKGPEIAYRALAALDRDHGVRARLVLAGDVDDEARASLARLAGDLGIADRVELRGRLDRDGLGELLQGAHALVAPAMWEEPAPMVALEAAVARVPVVASRVGGIPELLHDGEHALLFPMGEVDACATALAETLQQPEAAAARAERAFARARQFTFERYAQETREFVAHTMEAFAEKAPRS
jgi:glycosyltransferase involved in cell wall biosynthesis